MIRPTQRAVLLFGIGAVAALLVLAWNPSMWPFSFDVCLLVLLAMGVDALFILRPAALDTAVASPVRLPVGQVSEITVNLAGSSDIRPVRVEVLVDLDGPAETPAPVVTLFSGGRTSLSLSFLPVRRGVITVQTLWLRWCGPLGLMEFLVRKPLDRHIEVLPLAQRSYSSTTRFLSDSIIFGAKIQNKRGDGTEFDTLREHVAGMDSRFIDWKQSAKHRKLFSKQFRIERNNQVVLAYDTGRLMLESISGLARLDHAIEAGLMLSWAALRAGDFVGSFAFDAGVRHYCEPRRGSDYYARLQSEAARLPYSHEETNFTLGLAELNARLKRRALVVVFTDFVDSVMAELLIDSLKFIVKRHLVVFVPMRDFVTKQLIDTAPHDFDAIARAVVAHDFARDRAIVMQRIARLGVHCLDVPAGRMSEGLLNRYLEIKQKGLL